MIQSVFYNYNYAIILTDDGKVYSWGKNTEGQLGLGHTNNENTPKLIQFPNNVKIKYISSTTSNSIAIDEEGDLYVWGNNKYKQLGVPDEDIILEPKKLSVYCSLKEKEIKFKKVYCSTRSSIAISEHDLLYACGCNEFGQFGINHNELPKFSYTHLPSYVKVKSIQFLDKHSMVIGEDNQLYACGTNDYDRMGLKRRCGTCTIRRVSLPEETNVVSASSCEYNSIALTDKGELYSFGENFDGQLGTGDKEKHKIPVKISLPNNIKAKFISTGYNNSMAIGEDGFLYFWGTFRIRKLENRTEYSEMLSPKKITFPNDAKPISLSKKEMSVEQYTSEVTLIVCDDGNLYIIESMPYLSICGDFFLPLDITKDNENYIAKRVDILNEVKMKSIFANKNSLLITTENGDVYTLGDNKYGELGTGNEEKQLIPMKINLP